MSYVDELGGTLTAVRTLLVVDNCHVIIHMNRIEFTLLCAQGTADTACIALLLDIRPLVMGITLYQMLCLIRHQLNQVTRAAIPSTTWIASNWQAFTQLPEPRQP